MAELTAWLKEVFGQSILSKRKVAFSTQKNCPKVALTCRLPACGGLAIAFNKINTLGVKYHHWGFRAVILGILLTTVAY